MSRAQLVVLGCALFLISGCTEEVPLGQAPPQHVGEIVSARSPDPVLSATISPSAGATSSAAPASRTAAQVGQCFDYTSVDHLVIDSSVSTVSCEQLHTARTVYVGELTDPDVLSFAEAQPLQSAALRDGPDSLPTDLRDAYTGLLDSMQAARDECSQVIDDTVGLTLTDGIRQASILVPDLTGPTPSQWENGERWVRCNVVAVVPGDGAERADTLIPLQADLGNALKEVTYRECATRSPSGPRIPCDAGGKGTWVTLSDEIPTPRAPWPGVRQAQVAADSACVQLAKEIGASATPEFRAIGRFKGNGTTLVGFNEATWGTVDSAISCAIPLAQYASQRAP